MSEKRPEFNFGGVVGKPFTAARQPGEGIIPIGGLTADNIGAYCRRRETEERQAEFSAYSDAALALDRTDKQAMEASLRTAAIAGTRASLYSELASYIESGTLPD